MSELLSIGDFARATQLSIKALRHYQEQGLLEPTQIDAVSGYRRYGTELLPKAQIIRRLRSLGMPLEEIRTVLNSADIEGRNDVINHHLRRLQYEIAATQTAVAALQDLLQHPRLTTPIEHRAVPRLRVAAIAEDVELTAAASWLAGALGELYAITDAQGLTSSGVAGAIYADELFTDEYGRAIVYLPIARQVAAAGRVQPLEIPPVELAVITHEGPHDGIDREYATLAEYIARHELAVEGAIHEFYPVNRHHTADRALWRTEIGWPIFTTGQSDSPAQAKVRRTDG